MNHIKWQCTLGSDNCEDCNYDSHSDLFTCAICNASEGELTTECPNKSISYEMRNLCYHGAIDFINGQWRTLRPLTSTEEKVYNP